MKLINLASDSEDGGARRVHEDEVVGWGWAAPIRVDAEHELPGLVIVGVVAVSGEEEGGLAHGQVPLAVTAVLLVHHGDHGGGGVRSDLIGYVHVFGLGNGICIGDFVVKERDGFVYVRVI